jgi:hypothetical protein
MLKVQICREDPDPRFSASAGDGGSLHMEAANTSLCNADKWWIGSLAAFLAVKIDISAIPIAKLMLLALGTLIGAAAFWFGCR